MGQTRSDTHAGTPEGTTARTTGGTMSETVRYEVDEGVGTITLSRPEAMNGLDVATKEALLEAVRTCRAGRRRPVRGAHRQRPGVLRGPGPQGAHQDPAEQRLRVVVQHRRRALQPDRHRARHDGQAGGGRRQRCRRGCRRQPRLRVRLPCPQGVGRVQPRLHRGRAVVRHRLVVDPAPAGRPGQGDGAALLPPHPECCRVARARARHDRGLRGGLRGRGRRAGEPGWPAARPSPTARSGAPSPTPRATTSSTRWPSSRR